MADLEILVEQGALRGYSTTTESGFQYNGFLGIPYAKPPVGELRFADPQDPEPWEGIRNATVEGSTGPRYDYFNGKFAGSEDSLHLNVFTPRLHMKNGTKLPVMVWIHGGGFQNGSCTMEYHGPDFLIEEHIILVTINYRLGPYGFLCLNNEEVPGNAGLKDQALALRWVHRNIEAFGGDSDNITISGNSAGSASVHYHVLSPMSKGFFSKAVMQSGMSTCTWADQENPEEKAFRLAKRIGLDSKDKTVVLNFLRKASSEDLLKFSTQPFEPHLLYDFVPVVERSFSNVKAFITKHPVEIATSGDYNHVPCIIGMNSKEGIVFFMQGNTNIEDFSKVKAINDHGVGLKDILKLYVKDTDDASLDQLVKKVEEFYFGEGNDFMDGYTDLLSDLTFVTDIHRMVRLHSKNDLVYYYRFNYNGNMNCVKRTTKYNYHGAAHGDEFGYLWQPHIKNLPEGIVMPKADQADVKMTKRMSRLWANFVKVGNPTPSLSGDMITAFWEPVENNELRCMNIENDMEMIADPFKERAKFWEDILK